MCSFGGHDEGWWRSSHQLQDCMLCHSLAPRNATRTLSHRHTPFLPRHPECNNCRPKYGAKAGDETTTHCHSCTSSFQDFVTTNLQKSAFELADLVKSTNACCMRNLRQIGIALAWQLPPKIPSLTPWHQRSGRSRWLWVLFCGHQHGPLPVHLRNDSHSLIFAPQRFPLFFFCLVGLGSRFQIQSSDHAAIPSCCLARCYQAYSPMETMGMPWNIPRIEEQRPSGWSHV